MNIIISATGVDRSWGKKFKQNLCENCSKSIQMALQYVNFQNISWGTCPRTPKSLFCFSICFKLIQPQKTTLEKMSKFGVSSLKKFLLPDINILIELIYARPFPGLTSLYLVNIQSNSKSPSSKFLDPLQF